MTDHCQTGYGHLERTRSTSLILFPHSPTPTFKGPVEDEMEAPSLIDTAQELMTWNAIIMGAYGLECNYHWQFTTWTSSRSVRRWLSTVIQWNVKNLNIIKQCNTCSHLHPLLTDTISTIASLGFFHAMYRMAINMNRLNQYPYLSHN